MTDKEHNFAKDINVPSKKQIIIDGVDVSGCRNFDIESYKLGVYDCDLNELHGYCRCNNNCYFKQLARKTQECEELKEQLMETKTFDLFADKLIEKFNTDSAIASIFKNNTRYRKALEEIGGYCNKEREKWCTENCVRSAGFCIERNCYPIRDLTYILDIINKAKGEN